MTAHRVSLSALIAVLLSPCFAMEKKIVSSELSADEEPLYLLITGEPESFDKEFPPKQAGSPRFIGFAPVLYTLKTNETELAKQVAAALDKAEKTGYPVFFHLDDWNFPEDWKDPTMVEWTAFPEAGQPFGPLVQRRWINWGKWLVTPAPPNFESIPFRGLMRSRIQNGIAHPIAERLAAWRKFGRQHLFAGMAVGWETGFYGLTEIDPGSPPRSEGKEFQQSELVRTGYAALSGRGYDAAKIKTLLDSQQRSEEQVMYDLLVDVLHDYTEFLTRICVESGIPADRIYSHYAGMRTLLDKASEDDTASIGSVVSPMESMLRANPAVREKLKLHGVMVPLRAAINPWCRPGVTAAFDFCDAPRAAREFREAGKPVWGAVEIEITDTIKSYPACKAHLDELVELGAKVICLYGWWEDSDNQFAVKGTDAVRAMENWLEHP